METLQTDPAAPIPVEKQLIGPEKKQELLDASKRMGAFAEDLKMRRNAEGLRLNKMKQEKLESIFENMSMRGVDMTNRESVADYIAKLRAKNPELADNFEKSMDYFLTDSSQNNMNNINQNEALSEDNREPTGQMGGL